jgi:hypothetical protein
MYSKDNRVVQTLRRNYDRVSAAANAAAVLCLPFLR